MESRGPECNVFVTGGLTGDRAHPLHPTLVNVYETIPYQMYSTCTYYIICQAVMRVSKIFLFYPMYWALYDQQGSRWTIQVPLYLYISSVLSIYYLCTRCSGPCTTSRGPVGLFRYPYMYISVVYR